MGLKFKFGGGVDWLVYGALRKAQGLRRLLIVGGVRMEEAT